MTVFPVYRFLLTLLLGLSCSSLVAQVIYTNDFDQHTTTGPYTEAMWDADWDFPTFNDGVDEGRVTVVTGAQAYGGQGTSLAVFYPADEVGTKETGAQWKLEFDEEYEEAYLSYRVKFSDGFDFVRGGKLPGLAGGSAPSGSAPADGENGWAGRLMWRTEFTGTPGEPEQLVSRAISYAKYTDSGFAQDGRQEDKIYFVGADNGFSQLDSGVWYQITQRVKMNTPGVSDGIIQVWLDGELVHDQTDVLFRTVADLKIDQVFFSTFFGGGGGWETSKDETVFFDDFVVSIPQGKFHKVPESYPTIRDAIDASVPGDTVAVRGVHIDNVVLDKPITLRGYTGTRISARDDSLPVISVQFEGATVKRFVVRDGTGVEVSAGRENVTLDFLTTILSFETGIRINEHCNGCVVSKCKINLNNSTGLYVENVDDATIKDCIMIGNGQSGIHLNAVTNCYVDDNNVWRNGIHGILVQNSGNSEIVDNDARDNQVSGIVVISSDFVTVEENLAIRNILDGYVFDQSSNGTVNNNRSLFNDQGYVWRNSSNDNFVSGNESIRNDKNGFLFTDGQFNVLPLNYTQRNGENGFRLEAPTQQNVLTDSIALHNTGTGFIDLGTNNLLEDNQSYGD